ncbi:MAG TPA: hypothetical protein VM580_15395 [Labilithrix sp.]|nr:hypothetical protein [Labilithrix sp.]
MSDVSSRDRARAFRSFSVLGLGAVVAFVACTSGENGDECASHSDCEPSSTAARLCYGCSQKDICYYEGFPASYVCSKEDVGEPTGKKFSGSINRPEGGGSGSSSSGSSSSSSSSGSSSGGGKLDCDSSRYKPYKEIQVDSHCQAACIYTNGGNKSGCRASCETYQTVAKATTTTAVKSCPACSCR